MNVNNNAAVLKQQMKMLVIACQKQKWTKWHTERLFCGVCIWPVCWICISVRCSQTAMKSCNNTDIYCMSSGRFNEAHAI